MTIHRRNDETMLAANECAARIGLTVRALRLYEQRGLIRPRRTAKGWRLYGAAEIARLHEVLALKRLGLSLSRITALLQGRAVDLDGTLAVQQAALSEQRRRLDLGLSLVNAARATLAAGRSLSTEELIKLAKEANMTEAAIDDVAWRRYEQARPRTAIAIDPELLQNYVGHYRPPGGPVITITAEGGSLFVRSGQGSIAVEVLPESETTFFRKADAVQISFMPDADGRASELILHSGGHDTKAERISADEARKAEAALSDRVRNGVPHPDSEPMLRHLIAEHQAGRACVDRMTPELGQAVHDQFDVVGPLLAVKGALRALQFKGVAESGHDVYDAHFDAGALTFRIGWTEAGQIGALWMTPLP